MADPQICPQDAPCHPIIHGLVVKLHSIHAALESTRHTLAGLAHPVGTAIADVRLALGSVTTVEMPPQEEPQPEGGNGHYL